MVGLEQQDLERMNVGTLDLLYKNCESEINMLETKIAHHKLSIEKLSNVKSIINKVIFFKQRKKDDNSSVQREEVSISKN